MSYRNADGRLIEPTVHYLGDGCEPDGHRAEQAAHEARTASPPAGIGSTPYCLYCRHYRRDEVAPEPEPEGITSYVCHAFPAGIPRPIIDGPADHRKPYTGDHGIRFAQRPGLPAPAWVDDYGLPASLTE